MRPGPVAAVGITALLLLAACGGDDGSRSDAASGAPPQAGPEPSTRLVLTIRDHGRVVRVTRSTRITLVLGGRYRWDTPTSTGAAVDAQAVLSDAPTGIQAWELRALETGHARVTSRGSPACRPATPGCPSSGRRYVVTLDVRA